MRHVFALETELRQRGGCEPRRIRDTETGRRREIERASQRTAKDVRCRDASLSKFLDRVRRISSREHRRSTSLDRRIPQRIQIRCRFVCGRAHGGHCLVEIGESLDCHHQARRDRPAKRHTCCSEHVERLARLRQLLRLGANLAGRLRGIQHSPLVLSHLCRQPHLHNTFRH